MTTDNNNTDTPSLGPTEANYHVAGHFGARSAASLTAPRRKSSMQFQFVGPMTLTVTGVMGADPEQATPSNTRAATMTLNFEDSADLAAWVKAQETQPEPNRASRTEQACSKQGSPQAPEEVDDNAEASAPSGDDDPDDDDELAMKEAVDDLLAAFARGEDLAPTENPVAFLLAEFEDGQVYLPPAYWDIPYRALVAAFVFWSPDPDEQGLRIACITDISFACGWQYSGQSRIEEAFGYLCRAGLIEQVSDDTEQLYRITPIGRAAAAAVLPGEGEPSETPTA